MGLVIDLPRRAVPKWTAQGAGVLNDTNVLPILEAVGKALRPDLDKPALIRGVNLCVQFYRLARECSTNRGVKDRERRLAMIYKKAKALDQLLAKDDSWMPFAAPPSSKESLCAPIKRLIEMIDHEIKQQGDAPIKAYQDSFKVRSPFEWLVGFYLPDVFLLMHLAPIRDQKEFLSSKSPYIRFAQAVLDELRIGVPGRRYSSGSIIRAARSRFAGEARRRREASRDRYSHYPRRDPYSWWRNALLRREMGLPLGPVPKEPQPGFYLEPVWEERPHASAADGQN